MKQFKDYMPTLTEKKGRFYFPVAAMVSAGVSLVVFVALVGWAISYPYQKARDVLSNLQEYALLIDLSKQNTQTIINSLELVIEENKDNTTLVNELKKGLFQIKEQLNVIAPVDENQLLAIAHTQEQDYIQAQEIIKNSPFKDLEQAYIPHTKAGQEYLQALQVEPPKPFEYQQLADGVGVARMMYVGAYQVEQSANKLLNFANHALNPEARNNRASFSLNFLSDSSDDGFNSNYTDALKREENLISERLKDAALIGDEKMAQYLQGEKERLTALKVAAQDRRKQCNLSTQNKAVCEAAGVDLKTGYFKEGVIEVILNFDVPVEAAPVQTIAPTPAITAPTRTQSTPQRQPIQQRASAPPAKPTPQQSDVPRW